MFDDTAADSGAEGYHHDVVIILRSARKGLAVGRAVSIIRDVGRDGAVLGELREHILIHPAEVVGEYDVAVFGVQRARHADADVLDILQREPRLLRRRAAGAGHVLDYGLKTPGGEGRGAVF